MIGGRKFVYFSAISRFPLIYKSAGDETIFRIEYISVPGFSASALVQNTAMSEPGVYIAEIKIIVRICAGDELF